jgi:hypothetical protein
MPPRSDSPRPEIATASDPLTSTTWRFEDAPGAARPSSLVRPNRVTNMARRLPSWRELQGLRPAVADRPAASLSATSRRPALSADPPGRCCTSRTPGRVRGCGSRARARPRRQRPPASRALGPASFVVISLEPRPGPERPWRHGFPDRPHGTPRGVGQTKSAQNCAHKRLSRATSFRPRAANSLDLFAVFVVSAAGIEPATL